MTMTCITDAMKMNNTKKKQQKKQKKMKKKKMMMMMTTTTTMMPMPMPMPMPMTMPMTMTMTMMMMMTTTMTTMTMTMTSMTSRFHFFLPPGVCLLLLSLLSCSQGETAESETFASSETKHVCKETRVKETSGIIVLDQKTEQSLAKR